MLTTDSPSAAVRLLTLDRPDDLNAMTAELCQALHDELDRIAADRSCRAVVLTGAGRAFCVGLDLKGYGEAPGNDGTDNARDRLGNQEHMSRLILKLRDTPQPVIAAVNGPAAGFGLALALGSDIRYASSEAVFRAVFLNVGVSNCDMGTSWLLPRLIGASRAHELMLTGRRVRADEAERIGLVAEVVDGDSLLDRSLEAAEQIAAWTPWGIRLTKQGMWAALEIASERAAIEYEDRQQIMALHGTAPARGGHSVPREAPGGVRGLMSWSDEVDSVIDGDLTAGVAYVTPAGGVVVTAVAPVGLRDREAGTVGFTTSLGFGKKLERIKRNPKVALVYHAREHGFADSDLFVVVQGVARPTTDPDRDYLENVLGRTPSASWGRRSEAFSGTAGSRRTTRIGYRSRSRSRRCWRGPATSSLARRRRSRRRRTAPARA